MIELARFWALLLLPLPFLTWFLLPAQPAMRAVLVPHSVWQGLHAIAARTDIERLRPPVGLLLRLFGWTCLVLALAGPRSEGPALLPPSGRDLIVAVDLSASMAKTDIAAAAPVERIDAIREIVGRFAASRQGDRMALIGFASEAFLIAPLTFDTSAIAAMLDELTISMPGRKTDLGQAVGLAVRTLQDAPPGERLLIVFSDGEANTALLPALDAASLASDIGLTVHMVGFAGRTEPEHAEHMREIAAITGGRYFDAASTASLEKILAEIERSAPLPSDGSKPRLIADWTWVPLSLALTTGLLIGWREMHGR